MRAYCVAVGRMYWELELESSQVQMTDMLRMQKEEANNAFGKFVKKNYVNWIQNPAERPLMSPDLFKKKVFPLLDNDEKVFFILIDNFRLDQWRVVKDLLAEYFTFDVASGAYRSFVPGCFPAPTPSTPVSCIIPSSRRSSANR